MFSTVLTAAIYGVEAVKVTVEADVSDGLPMFSMVGFLASEVRESQDRVRTALRNTGFVLPTKRITVNLAPADMRKSGSGFDLPIAVSVLGAMGELDPEKTKGFLMAGELSLNGSLCRVRGVIEMLSKAKSFGCSACIVPEGNLAEGSVVSGITVYGAHSLKEVLEFFRGERALHTRQVDMRVDIDRIRKEQEKNDLPDFCDLKGQPALRRAAEIAAGGMHNLLVIGPPGSGKTMLAKRLPSILPRTTLEEALEITRIHSIAGELPEGDGILTVRPFRSPHHTVTSAALTGGGIIPRPGEVSLAHRGVLFLDELPEFQAETLETLRQPLEEGEISISRLAGMYRFPADFMLCAAMNPCKCGYYPDRNRCTCSARDVRRYLDHVSQPLLDRIDLCVEAAQMSYDQISAQGQEECSADIRKRVERVRRIQEKRYRGTLWRFNADLNTQGVQEYCVLGQSEENLLRKAYHKLGLTARSYTGILKTARTIADLAESEVIRTEHLSEAISYRALDKRYWGKEAFL